METVLRKTKKNETRINYAEKDFCKENPFPFIAANLIVYQPAHLKQL